MDTPRPPREIIMRSSSSSPMAPFPPTPSTPVAVSLKWPVSSPQSPSTSLASDSDGVEIVEAMDLDVMEVDETVDMAAHTAPEIIAPGGITNEPQDELEIIDNTEQAKAVVDGWEKKYQDVLSDIQSTDGHQHGPKQRRQKWLLTQVLEVQTLIVTSINIMRDCLQKFKADGHAVHSNTIDL